VGANDRDWMRVRSIYGWIRPEYIHAGTAAEQAEYARRQRVSPHDPPPIANLARLGTRAKARRRARGWLLVVLAAGTFAAGVGSVRAWHWFDDKYWAPGPKPPVLVHARARVWVPPSKYGHVKVIRVRVFVPRP
jgi:hypothetical protein